MEAIVICTLNGKCLPVLAASIEFYVPSGVDIFLSVPSYPHAPNLHNAVSIFENNFCDNLSMHKNVSANFGDAYNNALTEAFRWYDNVVIANDDVVLRPDTWRLMQEDVASIQQEGHRLGFLGCRSDYIMGSQNIRSTIEGDRRKGVRWESEDYIIETAVVAPIFAYLSKEAFQTAQFPPINWYSDNVICDDLSKAGFRHFISRGYVHHAGSQTVGQDFQRCHNEAAPWVQANRPELAKRLFAD